MARLKIQKGELNFDSDLWIFDELHKYGKWRNFLKGIFDLHHEKHQIFVTGSARLEAFAREGIRYKVDIFPIDFILLRSLKLEDTRLSRLMKYRNFRMSQGEGA